MQPVGLAIIRISTGYYAQNLPDHRFTSSGFAAFILMGGGGTFFRFLLYNDRQSSGRLNELQPFSSFLNNLFLLNLFILWASDASLSPEEQTSRIFASSHNNIHIQNNVLWDLLQSIEYSSYSIWMMEDFREWCQSHITLLWIWIILCKLSTPTKVYLKGVPSWRWLW